MADINDFPLYMGYVRINANVGFGLKCNVAGSAVW